MIQGVIIDVKYEVHSLTRTVSGIKQHQQGSMSKPHYFGGNGTYRMGYPEVYRALSIVVRVPKYPHAFIDVREEVLSLNGRKKITDKFVGQLKEALSGKRIVLSHLGGIDFRVLDTSVLKIW